MLKYFIGLYFVSIFISGISAEHAEITSAETEAKNRDDPIPSTTQSTNKPVSIKSNFSIKSGLFFNITITDAKLQTIKLHADVVSTKGHNFTKLKYTFQSADNSTRSEEFLVSGHKIKKDITVKGLEIGFCFKFQIQLLTTNGILVGPHEQMACTTPRRPDSSTEVVKTTATSISLLIQHPSEGHFDSFRLDYKNNARMLSMTVNKSFNVGKTETEISGLVPESCYNIDVYTVSFSEINNNPRSFTNVCTLAQLDPNYYTVIYGETSFTISWINFSDKYYVNVSCNSWIKMFSLNKPSLYVNRTLPGDCCVLHVKNWNDTVSRQYYVHVNETLPESPVVISNVATRTHLNLTWREPIRSNGWIHGYTVHMFDTKDTTIENFNIVCEQPEPKCTEKESALKHKRFQCSSYNLVNNRNANIYFNNSQFYLSIRGLKPLMVYYYSITAINKVGSNATDRLPVSTQADIPEEVRNVRAENIKSDSLTVCWDKPCFLNSDTVFYNVTLNDDIPYVNVYRSGAIPQTECEDIAHLLPYTYYTISVTASNQYGNTDPVVIMKQTDIAVPNQPRFSEIVEHATMMTVEWKPPHPYPGPTSYTVKVRDIENSETKECQTLVYNQTRCSVYGLEEYWQYEVTITAHTDRGNKQYEHPHYIRTQQSAPGPVTHLRVNHEKEKPRQVYITFDPPLNRDRNGFIKAYYVRWHVTRTHCLIDVVKLNKHLTELKIVVPDQVLLNISVFAETVENGTEVYQTVFVTSGETNTPLVPLVIAIIGWTLAIVLAGTTVFYKRQLHTKKSKTPVASSANYSGLSGANDLSDYTNIDTTQDSNEHYESVN